jgi:N-acetylgalactosamine-6-sulfatase
LRRRTASKSTPFFLYVPFTAPHAPYQGPDDRLDKPLPADSDRWRQGTASPQVYAAMVESMDKAIGRILAELDSANMAGNTLVVFTSDNGGTASARATKLRGSKGTTFEGGIRVPCIARWPGVLTAGAEYPHAAMTFDLTASIARLAGVQPPHPFDGIDILNSVARNESPPARAMFWRQRRGDRTWRGVREGRFKFVSDARGDMVNEFLFDLSADESESKNLLDVRQDDVRRIKAKLTSWEQEVKPIR